MAQSWYIGNARIATRVYDKGNRGQGFTSSVLFNQKMLVTYTMESINNQRACPNLCVCRGSETLNTSITLNPSHHSKSHNLSTIHLLAHPGRALFIMGDALLETPGGSSKPTSEFGQPSKRLAGIVSSNVWSGIFP